MDSTGKICVALDTDKTTALKIAEDIGQSEFRKAVSCLKVNRLVDQEAVGADGPPLFKTLAQYNASLWVDLKFFDVPRTVVARAQPYIESGVVDYLTVMAKGCIEMMMDAVEACGQYTKIIAVTELTSLTEEDVHLGSGHPSKASVIYLAQQAVLAGVKHLVCSGQELEVLTERRELIGKLDYMIPAVRPEWSQVDTPDQKRVITPVEALQKGAKIVIIGSPIVKDENPIAALQATVEEIENATDHSSNQPMLH